jgi:hypothetical protein
MGPVEILETMATRAESPPHSDRGHAAVNRVCGYERRTRRAGAKLHHHDAFRANGPAMTQTPLLSSHNANSGSKKDHGVQETDKPPDDLFP